MAGGVLCACPCFWGQSRDLLSWAVFAPLLAGSLHGVTMGVRSY